MRTGFRLFASGVVLVHLLAMAASALRVDALRAVTMPWEKVLGVHQTWPMFVNPERRTVWIRVVGEREYGTPVEIPALSGRPPAVIWTYDRRDKLVRNAVSSKREYLRTAIVRWACRQDPRLERVAVERRFVRTPAFGRYDDRPRHDWPVHGGRDEWNCPR